MPDPRPIVIGVDPALAHSTPEIIYTLRTLLQIAGYGYDLCWAGQDACPPSFDLYYGLAPCPIPSRLAIPSSGRSLADPLRGVDPLRSPTSLDSAIDGDRFSTDVIFTAFWLLIGAHEPRVPSNRWGDLDLRGSSFLASGALQDPFVSKLGATLRAFFNSEGIPSLRSPWRGAGSGPAFVFSHDVDYPEMIKWIECLRLLRGRGFRAWPSIRGVLRGTNHFWTFQEWVDFERTLGGHPTFYFMARPGSLLQYALGTPDDFYDIRTDRFRTLFQSLMDQGAEVGLHASFHAHRSVAQLAAEKTRVEEVAGRPILGNRHHYWHLDPAAPHETWRKLAEAGLLYDSSLGLEAYPGFRRGICHPFRPFDPKIRQEIPLVQLPVAWMDDHFDRRLVRNGIQDPDAYAANLLAAAQSTDGVVIVDYHSRGMNADFYPRYGPWLMRFMREHGSGVRCHRADEVATEFLRIERALAGCSRDRCGPGRATVAAVP